MWLVTTAAALDDMVSRVLNLWRRSQNKSLGAGEIRETRAARMRCQCQWWSYQSVQFVVAIHVNQNAKARKKRTRAKEECPHTGATTQQRSQPERQPACVRHTP